MTGRRRALIITCEEYQHEGLRRLRAPAADAEALSRVLGDPQIGAFDGRVMHNEAAHIVQGEIEDIFSESRADDVVLLHFSCHGLKSDAGELFFAAHDTRPNRLGSTAVSADFVQRCMRQSRARSIVLLLDCCYGGAFGRGVNVRASGNAHVLDSFPSGKLPGGRGRAVITASRALEYAFEEGELTDDQSRRPSVFTSAVVEGLATGEADRDEDGWVSLNELYDYVFDRVQERNPHQTPGRDVEMQGELYLARSQRRRIRPLPPPPELEAARTNPNMYARLGAVNELRARLIGNDLPAALGAHGALMDTARTDTRPVASPAEQAIRQVAVRPAVTELHFGRIAQGSPPPHRGVQLLGPPLARACVPQASQEWIHASRTDEGLDIAVDTIQIGNLHGSVKAKGPTGEAIISVDVNVVAQPSFLPDENPMTDTQRHGSREASGPLASPSEAIGSIPPGAPRKPRNGGRVSALIAALWDPTPAVNGPVDPVREPSESLQGDGKRPSTRGKRWGLAVRSTLWALMPTLSVGLLLPVPFVQAALRLHERRLRTIASCYTITWLGLWISSIVIGTSPAGEAPIPFDILMVISWISTVHAFKLRRRVFARGTPPIGA
ncbi:caspase family protein [Streptomyces violascens]|uniref:caspase family protein n=2 Tax=Streptomyces violascens TaxID=67381 RepID=UPI0036CD96A5